MLVRGTIKAIVLLKSQSLADCFFTGATEKQERCDRIGELRHETH